MLRTSPIETEKGGFTVTVTLPILPVLARTLEAGPCGDLTFVSGASGRPLTKESFGNLFKQACRVAGVPGSAHGVRKIAATRAAENGATVAELDAIFGWHGGGMASYFTREGLRTMSELLFPHLSVRCGRQSEKPNNFNADFSKWCGREDSNLHGLPR
jgi:integrase